MKHIALIIILLSIGLSSCSEDGSDSDSEPKTFLEQNKGTTWKYSEDEDKNGAIDGFEYVKFKSSMNMPFETWGSYGNHGEQWKCYSHFNFILNYGIEPVLFFEILENTPNKLVVQIQYRENLSETRIITKSGEKLKCQVIGDESGHSFGGTYYYEKTNDNIGNLEVCND